MKRDDGIAIDETWLESVGFTRYGRQLSWGYRHTGGRTIEVHVRNGDAQAIMVPAATRRDVRDLCRVMGLPIEQSQHGPG